MIMIFVVVIAKVDLLIHQPIVHHVIIPDLAAIKVTGPQTQPVRITATQIILRVHKLLGRIRADHITSVVSSSEAALDQRPLLVLLKRRLNIAQAVIVLSQSVLCHPAHPHRADVRVGHPQLLDAGVGVGRVLVQASRDGEARPAAIGHAFVVAADGEPGGVTVVGFGPTD